MCSRGLVLDFFNNNPFDLPRTFIGSGITSSVYSINSEEGVALKHGSSVWDGWLRYAYCCLKYEGIYPGLMKIHALRVTDEHCFFALMEKLPETLETYNLRQHNFWKEKRVFNLFEDLLIFLEQEGHSKGYAADLHDGNACVRENGEFVLIDPWLGPSDTNIVLQTLEMLQEFENVQIDDLVFEQVREEVERFERTRKIAA